MGGEEGGGADPSAVSPRKFALERKQTQIQLKTEEKMGASIVCSLVATGTLLPPKKWRQYWPSVADQYWPALAETRMRSWLIQLEVMPLAWRKDNEAYSCCYGR